MRSIDRMMYTLSTVADALALDRQHMAEQMLRSYDWVSWSPTLSLPGSRDAVLALSRPVAVTEYLPVHHPDVAKYAMAVTRAEMAVAKVCECVSV